jgi:EpsI family protein
MLSPFARRAIILAALMLGTSVLTAALTPKMYAISEEEQPDLEKLIPTQFGDWKMETIPPQIVVNPQQLELVNKLYSRVLSRTYSNSVGRRVMLSLAYGADQLHDTKIHRPELCYPAQGFRLTKQWKDNVTISGATIPVLRIETQLGERFEPVTYWIRIGNTIVRGSVEQSFARIGYGLKNQQIPDGILFRISEINKDTKDSFILQDQFITALLSAMTPAEREILIATAATELERKE